MAHSVVDLVLSCSQAPTTARFVLVILADRSNEAGVSWPSYGYLRERTGAGSNHTISKALVELEMCGELVIERPPNFRGRNRYLINLRLLTAVSATDYASSLKTGKARVKPVAFPSL